MINIRSYLHFLRLFINFAYRSILNWGILVKNMVFIMSKIGIPYSTTVLFQVNKKIQIYSSIYIRFLNTFRKGWWLFFWWLSTFCSFFAIFPKHFCESFMASTDMTTNTMLHFKFFESLATFLNFLMLQSIFTSTFCAIDKFVNMSITSWIIAIIPLHQKPSA